jgi:Excalibur calcium-binding domain
MLRRLALAALTAAALTALVAGPAAAADKDCEDFRYQEDAQEYFDARGGSATNDVDRLDGDGDGIVCESRPHRPSSGEDSNDSGTGDGQTGGDDESSAGGGSSDDPVGQDALPFTGPASTPLAIAAAILLSVGGGLLWRLRYRPSH